MQVKLDKDMEKLIVEIAQTSRRSPTQEVNWALYSYFTGERPSPKRHKHARIPRKQK